MAVLGIILAASIPRFAETTERLRTERTAFELVQHLRYAREQAVALGATVIWAWDEETRRAALSRVLDDGSTASLTDRWSKSSAAPEGVTVTVVREGVDDSVDTISFARDGTAQGTTLTVSHRNASYTLTINATTGQVRLEPGVPAR